MYNRITSEERMKLKLSLTKVMNEWIENVTDKDNNLGWLSDETVNLMVDSAFNIIEATNSLNVYLYKEELLD